MSSLRRLLGTGAVGAGVVAYAFSRSNVAEARDISTPTQMVPGAVVHAQMPSRAEQLNKLKQGTEAYPFDILIIGGGATGTGCAVDATTRCNLLHLYIFEPALPAVTGCTQ